jgi:hypothetical protein
MERLLTGGLDSKAQVARRDALINEVEELAKKISRT